VHTPAIQPSATNRAVTVRERSNRTATLTRLTAQPTASAHLLAGRVGVPVGVHLPHNRHSNQSAAVFTRLPPPRAGRSPVVYGRVINPQETKARFNGLTQNTLQPQPKPIEQTQSTHHNAKKRSRTFHRVPRSVQNHHTNPIPIRRPQTTKTAGHQTNPTPLANLPGCQNLTFASNQPNPIQPLAAFALLRTLARNTFPHGS